MFKRIAAAALALCLSAGTSGAVTYAGPANVFTGTGGISGAGQTVNFHWTNTKFEAFIAFKVDRSWDLFLTSISPANAYNGNQSGVVLVKTSTVPNERFGTSTACESAISPLSGLCTLINSSTSIGTVTPFISGLGAGSYMLGLYETGNPSSVSGTFLIAEVPVPATALLLLGALGIFGAASKRRRA